MVNDQPCFPRDSRIFEFFFQLSARRDHIEHRRTRDAIRKENEITGRKKDSRGSRSNRMDHVAFRTGGRSSQPGKDNTVTPSRRPVENCVHHGSPPDALGAGRPTSPARHDARRRSAPRTTTCTPPTYPPRGSSLSFLSFSAALLPFLHPASDRATSRRAASPPRSTENSSSTGITHPPLTPVILRYALTIVPVSFLHDEKEGALLSFLIVETRWATKME